MITLKDLYNVLSAVVPLYVTMFLAYLSVKWWKIFTPEQCAGINRFVAIFAVPLLSFDFISRINPYKMDLLFIAADGVSKVVILLVLFTWVKFSKRGSLDWTITLFSLLTLPNTLVMGIPLVKAMYGNDKESLMIQAVVLQCIIWYTLLLVLFEYREARILIMKKFHGSSGSTKNESSDENKDRKDGADEDEVVHVIVTRPSANSESQNLNKVARVAKSPEEDSKEVHLFIWRCGCCSNQGGVCEQSVQACSKDEQTSTKKVRVQDEKPETLQVLEDFPSMTSEMLRMILKMVWFKLIRNPNSYASLLGFSWALASCRWGITNPQIIQNSVTILSKAGLGMAMFSLGLFMALQPKIIACGNTLAAYGMFMRFVAGPAVMAAASVGVGLRGQILKVSIVQAALPQGIVPFVFAREYNLHPDVLSTAVSYTIGQWQLKWHQRKWFDDLASGYSAVKQSALWFATSSKLASVRPSHSSSSSLTAAAVIPSQQQQQCVPRIISRSSLADIVEFYTKNMVNENLGFICNAHVAHADQSEYGVLDEKCIKLAELAATAVDFPKTAQDGICKVRLEIYGYVCEEHTVTTQDGYILSMQRIPVGRSGGTARQRTPVLLQHGLLMDGITWLLNSPDQSLAYILADSGFDVWIANTRGTKYSRGHTSLSADDRTYWQWSWDQLVMFELPALVQYVNDQTGQKLHYVGHSLGTLIALASFSQNKLLDMLRSAASLSPIAHLRQISSPIARAGSEEFFAENLYQSGTFEFNPKG